jgi:hypothetical protein
MAKKKEATENNQTFVRISNETIYQDMQVMKTSLEEINKSIGKIQISFQDSCKDRSLLHKLVNGAYAFTMIVLGWLIAHITKG